MKTAVVLTLIAGALSAPAPTLTSRQFGFGSWTSLLPKPGSSGSSSGGFDFPSLGSWGLGGSSSSEDSSSSSSSSGGFGGLGSFFGGGSSTASDVTDNSGCKDLTFIFARGTTETGNMGTVIGPKVASELNSLTNNNAAIQGVNYPANAAGNAQLGAAGGPEMADLVNQALQQCPDTKVVLGGYSQGAMVVHNAAGKLQAGQVVGAVTFGDPFKTQHPDTIEHFKTWCATGDPVCRGGANFMAHLSYGSNAAEAAQFLVSAAGL